ncbi:NUDIX domain-containing protein [Desulfonema magnum]|uniref:GDP-mannose pyrophosphatase n=1 Tax=Desulfonema magnum TaxID=45655 RepID=A0A975GP16_9BACT|nr:NUDIX hydrolase [Desulfonema magnum]QTA87448.1 Hydrolase, NUDIX family [Desulfonema magnum]
MSAKVNKRTTLHQGRVFKIVTENITLSNGVTIDMEIVHHPGASAIVPLSDRGTVIMVRQYRHAIGDYIWEIPAGTLGPEEAPLACAKRELTEETGFSANNWQKLGEITPIPAYSDERIHLFLATDLSPAEQNLDEDEILNVHEIKFDEAMEMVYKGKIQDSKSISGLFMAKHICFQSSYLNPGI